VVLEQFVGLDFPREIGRHGRGVALGPELRGFGHRRVGEDEGVYFFVAGYVVAGGESGGCCGGGDGHGGSGARG